MKIFTQIPRYTRTYVCRDYWVVQVQMLWKIVSWCFAVMAQGIVLYIFWGWNKLPMYVVSGYFVVIAKGIITYCFGMKQTPNVFSWGYPKIWIFESVNGVLPKGVFSSDTIILVSKSCPCQWRRWSRDKPQGSGIPREEINLRGREYQGKKTSKKRTGSTRFQVPKVPHIACRCSIEAFFPSLRVLLACFTPHVKTSLIKWTSHSTKSHDLNPSKDCQGSPMKPNKIYKHIYNINYLHIN